ncbi:MAG: TonB-dependent receptor [Verrucomicrobia bacterium]|nr:TonB-dependent receptor [Verrucomicrobiota bacterium]
MKINPSFLIFAGVAWLPCVALWAQESAGTPPENSANESVEAAEAENVPAQKAITGKAVRVTAAKHEMEMADVPMSVAVVSGDEITKSSAATVADLLDDVPGVQVEANGTPGFKQVNIRGESNQRVLILVDGQRISETKGMNGAPLLMSVQDVERVEVIKGPASVLYGSEAIGGVVNIITKKSGKEGVHGSASVRGDTGTRGLDQYYDLNARYGDFSARVSFSDEDHGDIESPDGRVDRTSYRFQNTSAYLAYDISENASFGLKIESFAGRSEVASGDDLLFMELPRWDREKIGLFLEVKDISETFVKFRADAYFQKTDKHFVQDITQTVAPMTINVNADRRNLHDAYGAEIQADFSIADTHYLIVGAQIDYVKLDSHEETTTQNWMTLPMGTRYVVDMTRTNDYDADILTAALFAQDEWNFAEGWNLVLGARGTYVKNEFDEGTSHVVRRAGTNAGTTVETLPQQSKEDADATFSLSLVNSQIENWTFRGTVSQGYRYASINELYIGSAMASTETHANPNLEPEKSISYELGTRYDNGNFSLDATVFYTDSDDYIGTETRAVAGTGATSVWFVNYDSAKSFGAELSTAYLFELGKDAAIKPYAVATFLRRRFDNASGSTYDTGQPEIFGKAGVLATYTESNRNWWADFNLRGNAAAEEKISDVSAPGGSKTQRKPGWATLNFAIGLDVFDKSDSAFFEKLTLAVGIDNILDKRYELPHLDYLQPGRSFWASLKYEF